MVSQGRLKQLATLGLADGVADLATHLGVWLELHFHGSHGFLQWIPKAPGRPGASVNRSVKELVQVGSA
jgi:hypothetical protein